MTKLQKYERVNKCETIEQLQQCILDFANKKGFIEGRVRKFNAQQMANNALYYYNGEKIMGAAWEPNCITKEFGLRQQAMYLKYYK